MSQPRPDLIVTDAARPWQRWADRISATLYTHRGLLPWIHLVMLVFFVTLIFLPLALPDPDGQAKPWNDFVVFARFLMWGVWFPLTLLSVVISGRSWCGLLCPMGAASEWANRYGLQRPIPGWLRWEGTPIVSFILVTTLGQTVGVRDHPEAMAEIFGGTLLAAIVVGLIYGSRKRAWCRHLCPIGLLLGVFSRLGAVQFTPKRKKAGGDRYTTHGICPTLIDVVHKEESRHCIECFRCVKPDSPGSLRVRLRPPGEEVAQIRDHHPNSAEVWFFFLGTGSALGGFLWLVLPLYQQLRQQVGEWFIEREMYWIGESGPWWLMSVHPERREVFNWLDFMMIVGFMTAVMLLFGLVLAALTLLASWLSGKLGADGSLRSRFNELAYQFMPVALASLIIGLGGELFNLLLELGLTAGMVAGLKGGLMVLALLWSVALGNQILRRQQLRLGKRLLAAIPGVLGSGVIAAAWFVAIFGL
ncbi:MAG TPA: 4Fe-4S binding protein [Motiliproteus sp.]